jgi:cytochrome c oxidase subunit 3
MKAEDGRSHRTGSALQIGQSWGMREWYVLTYIFGSIFVAGQVLRVRPPRRRWRHPVESDAYGSVFYLATGFHGLHVTGGLIAFLLIIGRTFTTRRYTHACRRPGRRHLVLLALRRRRVDRAVRDDLPAEVTP